MNDTKETSNLLIADSKLDIGVSFPNGKKSYTGSTNNPIYSQYLSDLYSFSINLGTSLAVLMIVYAGYKYMTSQGNQSAINDAKEILYGALLGMAMLLLIKLILKFLGLPTVI